MKYLKLLGAVCAFVALTVCSTDLTAQRTFALGFNAGTTGVGAEGTFRITNKLNARIGYHAASATESGTYDEDLEVGIGYDATLDISSLSVMVDFFPFTKFLKLTAGFYQLNWGLQAGVVATDSYEIEGRTFEPERLGNLTANVDYPSGLAPYLGIGFGNAVARGLPIKLNINLGVIKTGAPQINMVGEGMIGPTADNAASFQTGLNELEWYPVVNLGISIAFMNVAK